MRPLDLAKVEQLFEALRQAQQAKSDPREATSALIYYGVRVAGTARARNDLFHTVDSYVPDDFVSPYRVIGMWGGDRDVQFLSRRFHRAKRQGEKMEIVYAMKTIGGAAATRALASLAAQEKEPLALAALHGIEDIASIYDGCSAEGGSMPICEEAVAAWESLRQQSSSDAKLGLLRELELTLGDVKAKSIQERATEVFRLVLTSFAQAKERE